MLNAITTSIDNMNAFIGKAFSWLTLAMVILMSTSVLMRYLLSTSLVWQQELIRYMYGMVFLACAAWAWQKDKHVRVDIFYHNFSTNSKAWVNLLGTLLLLFPMAGVIIYYSYDFTLQSWEILETSPEYQGMPGVFIYKSFIWFFAFTLLLQGISTIIHALNTICEAKT